MYGGLPELSHRNRTGGDGSLKGQRKARSCEMKPEHAGAQKFPEAGWYRWRGAQGWATGATYTTLRAIGSP